MTSRRWLPTVRRLHARIPWGLVLATALFVWGLLWATDQGGAGAAYDVLIRIVGAQR